MNGQVTEQMRREALMRVSQARSSTHNMLGTAQIISFANLHRCMEGRAAGLAEFELTRPEATSGWFEFGLQAAPEGLFVLSLDIKACRRTDLKMRAVDDLERRVQRLQMRSGRRWLHTRRVSIPGEGLAEEPHALLAAIVESSTDAIIGRDLEGVVTSWNKGAEQVFGYSADEVIGKPLSPLFPDVFGLKEALLLDRLRQGERLDPFERGLKHKDGGEIDLSVSVSPILDSGGTLIGISEIARDITEGKRSRVALACAKEAAEAANRELESFSYSVAHDLRAPLRSIDGFSRALLEDHGEKLDADGQELLSSIREAAQQMVQFIDDLLGLSRLTRGELRDEWVDLGALAQAVILRLQRAQPHRRVKVVIHERLTARGDPRLLTVLLDNLLGNAWKFTGRSAEAQIEFGASSKAEGPVYFVRDNGAGFDMAFASRLFGVFQRLHAATEFEGTGVGLATVQRVVKRHGGRVWARGEVDRGAAFFFTLHEPPPEVR